MRGGPEAASRDDVADHPCEVPLEAGRRDEVFDVAAVDADEMMVVTGKLFGELEARGVVGPSDSADDAGLLENGKAAIRGALRETPPAGQELGRGCGTVELHDGVDQRAATSGVALTDVPETPCDRRVQLVVHDGQPIA